MKSNLVRILAAGGVCLLTTALPAQYALNWSTVGSPSHMIASTDAQYSLALTVGQPAPGNVTNGEFRVDFRPWAGLVVPASGEVPTLFIGFSAGAVVIRWLPATPGFVLEETDDLFAHTWSAAPAGNPVALPTDQPARFYRLRKL